MKQDKLKLNWRGSMLNKEQLEAVLFELSETSNWFFTRIEGEFSSTDLIEYLPKTHIDKVSKFVESHTFEELESLMPEDFVTQATGEKLSKILKMIEVEKKKQSLEQDFI